MNVGLLYTATFSLAHGGLTAISLAMPRHYRQLRRRSLTAHPEVTWCLGILGWTGLAASLAVCLASKDWSIGMTVWLGSLTPAAVSAALLLAYKARWTQFVGIVSAVVGIVTVCAIRST